MERGTCCKGKQFASDRDLFESKLLVPRVKKGTTVDSFCTRANLADSEEVDHTSFSNVSSSSKTCRMEKQPASLYIS